MAEPRRRRLEQPPAQRVRILAEHHNGAWRLLAGTEDYPIRLDTGGDDLDLTPAGAAKLARALTGAVTKVKEQRGADDGDAPRT